MLSTLMLWTLTDPLAIVQQSQEESEHKFRWPHYSSIIKKLKKEIAGGKVPYESRNLLLFLPLPKKKISFYVMSPCTPCTAPSRGAMRLSSALLSPPLYRCGLRVSQKMKMSSYDFIGQNIKDNWKWSWFQASRVDCLPCPVQKWVARLLTHTHQLECPESYVITEADNLFLSAPDQDAADEAPPSKSSSKPSSTYAPERAPAGIATEAITAKSEETATMVIPRGAPAENVVLTHEATTLQDSNSTTANTEALAGTSGLGRVHRRGVKRISAGISKSVRMDKVKSHTKTKIQERINKKRLEAIRLSGTLASQQIQQPLMAGPVHYQLQLQHLESLTGRSGLVAAGGQMGDHNLGIQAAREGQYPLGAGGSVVGIQMPR